MNCNTNKLVLKVSNYKFKGNKWNKEKDYSKKKKLNSKEINTKKNKNF